MEVHCSKRQPQHQTVSCLLVITSGKEV